MQFEAEAAGHTVTIDTKSPVGNDSGFSPKELLGISVCGCTAMDVVGLLRKYKQPLESCDVSAEITKTENVYPAVFTEMNLTFDLKGKIEKDKAIEAVHLSQTKYCGVSAMLSKAFPIHYKIVLNGETIGSGTAAF